MRTTLLSSATAGEFSADAFCLPAAGFALGGGDFWDLAETQFGARLIVGDAIGNGAPAARIAAEVLSGWRALARHEPTLRGLALRLDSMTAQAAGAEGFATAVLMTLPKRGRAEVVCCGHPPPLLVHGSSASWSDALPPMPPLGLMELADCWAETQVVPFAAKDLMLLFTDGVTESCDADGRPYPLEERVVALTARNRERLLPALMADLREHGAGRRRDDILAVLVQRDRR